MRILSVDRFVVIPVLRSYGGNGLIAQFADGQLRRLLRLYRVMFRNWKILLNFILISWFQERIISPCLHYGCTLSIFIYFYAKISQIYHSIFSIVSIPKGFRSQESLRPKMGDIWVPDGESSEMPPLSPDVRAD